MRCSEDDTMRTISEVFNTYGYLIDTHTAVAYRALCEYRAGTDHITPAVVVSTASPFKFCESVLKAIGRPVPDGGSALLDELEEATGVSVPAPLKALKGSTPRFECSVTTDGMKDAVMRFLAN
jgi:threonine synthase